MLAQMPRMGHTRGDVTDYPVLFLPVGAYLVIYRADRQPIEIVAVTQGSRDIPASFTSGLSVRPEGAIRGALLSSAWSRRRAG